MSDIPNMPTLFSPEKRSCLAGRYYLNLNRKQQDPRGTEDVTERNQALLMRNRVAKRRIRGYSSFAVDNFINSAGGTPMMFI
jgi:hypothetical protein